MKLRQIKEGLLSKQVREKKIKSAHPESLSLYAQRPEIQINHLYNSMGHDSGARSTGLGTQGGFTSHIPTGVPQKPRHRVFLGMENRPGSIRL